ncbi:hypothetical protein ACFL25_00940 [Patescibacteria group bacterium]
MKKISSAKLVKTAKKLNEECKRWHFHILAPGCKFNKDKRYALILENTSDKEEFVHFCLKKPSRTGKKLVEMLHGKGISKKKKKEVHKKLKKLSAKVEKMIKRATELNAKGFSWHHHVLFPDCMFNKDSRYWTLVFEDSLNHEVIEERFKDEPIEALLKIEPLFYAQDK